MLSTMSGKLTSPARLTAALKYTKKGRRKLNLNLIPTRQDTGTVLRKKSIDIDYVVPIVFK